jgi:hypothetical protein
VAGIRDFLVHNIDRGSGTRPASYSEKGSFLFFPLGGKEAEVEAENPPPSSVEVRNKWRNISTALYGSKARIRTALLTYL